MNRRPEDENAPIRSIGKYRGVALHDQQPTERIERVVKPQIDNVYDLADLGALYRFAGDIRNAPEARLFAAAKCEAAWLVAADERRSRPTIDMEKIHAAVAGLDSERWRSTTHYCSDLDVPPAPGAAGPDRREIELDDE